MPRLPEIVLDDRHFQDLVNEARMRVARRCPEWTDHNVSDPGITLIELFAWLTETLVYRVNRIPAKLHVALLELLGMRLRPPTAATTDIRFRLAAAPDEDVVIAGGDTEIATQRLGAEQPVVFQTEEDFTIPVARPIAYAVERDGKAKDVGVARGVASPKGPDQLPFGAPPKVGDALYLGFDKPIGRLVMQVDVDCSQARGAGVDPQDPPLRWEVSVADGDWEEAEVLVDRTGGFNYGSGVVELQLPDRSAPTSIAGARERADAGRGARGPQRGVGRLGVVGRRRVVRRERSRRSPLHARPGQRRRRARACDPGRGRLLAPIRGGAAEGHAAPVLPLPARRRAARERAPRNGHDPSERDSRRGVRREPAAGARRRRRRDPRCGARTCRARVPHAPPGGDGGGLRVHRPRGLSPRGACRLRGAAERRRCARPPAAAGRPGRPQALERRADAD